MTRSFVAAFASALVATLAAGCWASDTTRTPAAGAGSSTAGPSPASVAIGPTGRIRGSVRLAGAPPPERSEPVGQNQNVCGQSVPVTHAHVAPNGGLRQAFVYLDKVPATSAPAPRATLEVEQRRCEYLPHSMIAPMGASLEIVNDDPILHNIHARETTPQGLRTVFNIAQPIRGQRTTLDAPFTKPGVVTLTCEAGHPWMTAYILVANHPYVAVTGDDGSFVIENVPVGTYPITMWHEGVSLTRMVASLQRYEYEDPYELTEEVVVAPNADAEVTFSLTLRDSK